VDVGTGPGKACTSVCPQRSSVATCTRLLFTREGGLADDNIGAEQDGADILVNAAGISQERLLFKMDDLAIQSILDTNLLGATLGCRVLGKRMARRGGGNCSPSLEPHFYASRLLTHHPGCIINVSSLLAYKGGRVASVYAAS
jgi:NAD(P)-dependent dehydrogenase (short-subunit alcohol dehydrogenase family)